MDRIESDFWNRHDEVFRRLANIGNVATLSPEERYEYECDLKYARDYNARISFAEQKGMELGYEKGIEKGIKEGIEQGIEKGIEQGIEKGIELGIEQGVEKGIEQGIEVENLRIAKNLISMGLPVDSIIKATGLSADRLEQLRNEAED